MSDAQQPAEGCDEEQAVALALPDDPHQTLYGPLLRASKPCLPPAAAAAYDHIGMALLVRGLVGSHLQ
jgi:hypothetical protein